MPHAAPSHAVAYFSLGGTTARVAAEIAQALEARGQEAYLIDLGLEADPDAGPLAAPPDCLWVLSPVYTMHPAPPVMDYLATLPQGGEALAVPLATYGVVCSGVALAEMGALLVDKGYRLAGAAKVVAEHSMLWSSEPPLGQGRPGPEDLEQVRGLAQTVAGYLAAPEGFTPLAPASLDYQPEAVRTAAAQRSLAMLRGMFPPMELDQEACDQCGLCADACYTGNITLDPAPVFGDECVYCLNCLRTCPQEAIGNPILGGLEQELRRRAAAIAEPAQTRVFLGG